MEEPEGKKVNRARGERNGERQSRKEEMEADRHVERWVGRGEEDGERRGITDKKAKENAIIKFGDDEEKEKNQCRSRSVYRMRGRGLKPTGVLFALLPSFKDRSVIV
ncbi:hypothetical protein RRG08_048518 [Elysia crispata]|uniref:Uncharacterized protein n=1 Tax=Elysia crispata TaxID=231223 RepID=A0AAE1B520_9GAST|nr:hypothetical protein RRG08_048518 [Elysia crispata]